MKLHHLITLILIGLSAPTAPAQNLDLPYSSSSTGADGPFIVPPGTSAASGVALAYDAERQTVVRFGGINSAALSQTWLLQSSGWQLATPATSPPARSYSAMAFDDIRKEVVLFGGVSGSTRLNDTWVWNGTTWAQKTPVTSPPARWATAMAWDPIKGQIVLFGGSAGGAMQDTWVWTGDNWLEKTPVTSPSARMGHAMATYPPTSVVAMACGNGSTTLAPDASKGDLWLWDGENWASAGTVFPVSEHGSLTYDPVRTVMLHFGGVRRVGNVNTALGSLTSWSHTSGPANRGGGAVRYAHGAVWETAQNRMILTSGRNLTIGELSDTWAWTGSEWFGLTIPEYTFDMNSKPEAIWNFTSIQIPAGTTVRFKKNPANHAVLWLASEDVNIAGTLSLPGSGGGLGPAAIGPAGGPGGYDGGPQSTSGQGPGGGRAQGVNGWSIADGHGEGGKHAVSLTSGTYGTPFAQPLFGGSGGGGGVPKSTFLGGQGGGGGGAIAIACSRDLYLSGRIAVNGGPGGGTGISGAGTANSGYGGAGSGGTVRLVADRIIAPAGVIDARGGSPSIIVGERGRIRLEGFIRQVTDANLQGVFSKSVPVLGSILTQAGGRLSFVKVAGKNVANSPRGDELNPDVIFTADGEVEIEVHALNVPDGTPVTVTLNHSIAGVINLPAAGQPPVLLQQCKALFTAAIPAGSGVMQAFATYNVGGPPPAP